MIQPLHLQLLGTFQTTGKDTGKVVFTFPPVPQGLIWTGAITVSSPQGSDPQGLVWTLFRNGTPFLSGHEWPCFGNVQAVGQEVMQLVGVYIGANSVPTYAMTASWTGYSAANSGEAPALSPEISGSTRGLVQVYNTQGPGGPLSVVAYPLPSSVLTDYTPLVGTVGDSGPLLGTITAASYYSLWELTVQISMAQLAAVAGVQSATVEVKESGGTVLLHHVAYTTPGATVNETVRQRFYGLNMPAGQRLSVTLSATGASSCTAVAHAIATQNPT